MEALAWIALAAALGALGGAVRWLVDNDENFWRALRFEIAPWR